MVRIGTAQQQILESLQDAKKGYDKEFRDAEAAFRTAKEVARYKLSLRVREAIDAGIPNRQVALKGLGYADVGSLKQFLVAPNAGTATSAELQALNTPVIPAQPITYVKEERKFLVTDSAGVVHRVPFFFQEEGVPYKIVKYALHKMTDEDAENTQRIISQDFPDIEWED
jgi:hypothetical protein